MALGLLSAIFFKKAYNKYAKLMKKPSESSNIGFTLAFLKGLPQALKQIYKAAMQLFSFKSSAQSYRPAKDTADATATAIAHSA